MREVQNILAYKILKNPPKVTKKSKGDNQIIFMFLWRKIFIGSGIEFLSQI